MSEIAAHAIFSPTNNVNFYSRLGYDVVQSSQSSKDPIHPVETIEETDEAESLEHIVRFR
jgi:hypothetical protein